MQTYFNLQPELINELTKQFLYTTVYNSYFVK